MQILPNISRLEHLVGAILVLIEFEHRVETETIRGKV
jgi:hypothetical protein